MQVFLAGKWDPVCELCGRLQTTLSSGAAVSAAPVDPSTMNAEAIIAVPIMRLPTLVKGRVSMAFGALRETTGLTRALFGAQDEPAKKADPVRRWRRR
jgi:hypothetical protein